MRHPAVRALCLSSSSVALALSAGASAVDIFLNEWNCVGSQKWLGNPGSPTASCPQPDGPQGFGCSNNDDTFFGRVMGNGGDWIELVVVKDHLDIRGWQIQWKEPLENDANGQDIWTGFGCEPQGTITFTDHPIWSGLRAGTIITITERGTALGGLDTDFSFDPCRGDWWINVCAEDTLYLTCVANVCDPAPNCQPTPPEQCVDPFDVGNGNWQARILNAQGQVHIGLVGEGAPCWMGSGVNSREVVKLRQNPSASINVCSDWRGGDSSTFGSQNSWTDTVTQCRVYQDFTAVRAAVYAELCSGCLPLFLNEYNAVKADRFLNGGTEAADSSGGQAADTFFGRVLGNGGDWFEIVVAQDHLDIRGWRFLWQEVEGGKEGEIVLTNHAFWSDLRAGTILTFIEKTTAEGGLDTDLSLDFGAGDRWANINTFDTSLVAFTTSTNPDHVSGRFTTSNDKWRLAILDSRGNLVIPWAGEGSPWYYRGGVSSTEVCRLREDAAPTITPNSAYDDVAFQSTFGAPNTWRNCPSNVVITQSFAALPSSACVYTPPCAPADFNCDGVVNGDDLGTLLGFWGSCPTPCPADLNGDGVVDGSDLGALLGQWS